MAMPYQSVPLTSGWTFKQGGLNTNSPYLPANDLPTEVHRDLLKNNKIEDPYKDLNELSVRWIADEKWTYRKSFPTPPSNGLSNVMHMLIFEGLDTYASVYVNGKKVSESSNMFIEYKIPVTGFLKKGNEENTLQIVFESARQKGLQLVKEHQEHRFIVHQTEISRGPVRKAQYHWGWDWGPILLTCGPWKPIKLETYVLGASISDVKVEYQLSEDLKWAKGTVFVSVDNLAGMVQVSITNGEEEEHILGQSKVYKDSTLLTFDFDLEGELWWPRGYGPQTLYTITATILEGTTTLSRISKTIGFRKVELVQDKDAYGQSFHFRINNIDVFAGGSCWIPADSFVSQISPERYRNWVKLAASGNQIMLRVWGGGIYEHDTLYSACDEFGVLVWQDFMFACANYPAYDEYLSSVEEEARQNVRRLRNHPSIVIWAGNNEDYQIVERYGLEYRFTEDKNPDSWLKTNFPARYIYEYLLPRVVEEETNGVPYRPSSPWGNGTSTVLKVDPMVGDVHQWNVWHGEMKPYQQLPRMGGRFVSEFGMEAYPHLETIEKCISREEDRYPGSMAMDFRNKAIGHERRLISYVAENFQIKYDLPSFTHLTQVMQADAIFWAYKSWRRQWGTEGKRQCGGVLVWQLNDCWPTISWAIADYYLVPKPAYYAIKRAMEPVVVGVRRRFHNWTMRPTDELWQRDTSHIDMRRVWQDVEFDVWVASSKMGRIEGEITVKFISVETGKEVLERLVESVEVNPNSTTEVLRGQKVDVPGRQSDNKAFDMSKADPFVIHVSLETSGQEVARDVAWPDPIKYLRFPERGLNIQYSDDKSNAILSTAKPVKGFVFCEKQSVRLSDNGFDLMPGEEKKVSVIGTSAKNLEWKYIGME
ncbi:glycoside hydrolase [Lojkania enalia]|uniref:Beta-mannosidase n=1 Tax=Lojkania enalia TaxID=147567 RepID=A0A9P4K3K5_9PLEO|nr:glycoside hydrolase [Didymosphaeria enalia]